MTTKRQRRFEDIREKKAKKSTRMIYFAATLGGIVVLLIIFFVTLFSAIFPPVDTEALKKKEKQVMQIYFSDDQERFLRPEKRFVVKETDPALQAKAIAEALIDGSKTKLIDTFPRGVAVKDAKMEDAQTVSISFSKNLTKAHPGSGASEMATIYSLTNSITQNISTIKKVKILVEGRELSSIKGHISTLNAFSPDLELIVSEN